MAINKTFLSLCRTIHIYLSMLGFLVLLFFGITGFTVNHEDWFGATEPRTSTFQGQTPADLIGRNDQLHIVEHLRSSFHITGALASFDALDETLHVGFKEPGQTWEVDIEKASGATSVHRETFNLMAVINNLHRGRYSGAAWRWVIDISAALIVLACATGVVLWLALPRRRRIGIAALAVGVVGTVLVYLLLVPGRSLGIGSAAVEGAAQARQQAPP